MLFDSIKIIGFVAFVEKGRHFTRPIIENIATIEKEALYTLIRYIDTLPDISENRSQHVQNMIEYVKKYQAEHKIELSPRNSIEMAKWLMQKKGYKANSPIIKKIDNSISKDAIEVLLDGFNPKGKSLKVFDKVWIDEDNSLTNIYKYYLGVFKFITRYYSNPQRNNESPFNKLSDDTLRVIFEYLGWEEILNYWDNLDNLINRLSHNAKYPSEPSKTTLTTSYYNFFEAVAQSVSNLKLNSQKIREGAAWHIMNNINYYRPLVGSDIEQFKDKLFEDNNLSNELLTLLVQTTANDLNLIIKILEPNNTITAIEPYKIISNVIDNEDGSQTIENTSKKVTQDIVTITLIRSNNFFGITNQESNQIEEILYNDINFTAGNEDLDVDALEFLAELFEDKDPTSQYLHLVPSGYRLENVEGDGNCLFRAIAALTPQLALDHAQIRSITAQEISNNVNDYRGFITGGSMEDYANLISRLGEWGDHLEIQAIANALNLSIEVHGVSNSHLVVPREINKNTQTIRVLYTGVHYMVILPENQENAILESVTVNLNHTDQTENKIDDMHSEASNIDQAETADKKLKNSKKRKIENSDPINEKVTKEEDNDHEDGNSNGFNSFNILNKYNGQTFVSDNSRGESYTKKSKNSSNEKDSLESIKFDVAEDNGLFSKTPNEEFINHNPNYNSYFYGAAALIASLMLQSAYSSSCLSSIANVFDTSSRACRHEIFAHINNALIQSPAI